MGSLLLHGLVGLVVGRAFADGVANAPERVTRVLVHPPQVTLESKRRHVQLVVTGVRADGHFVDLTRDANFAVDSEKVARIVDGRAVAVADGTSEVVIRFEDDLVRIPVEVKNSQRPDPVSFRFETLAAITKQGCNAGSCHGSPVGKGGFSLSLFAYDPEHDQRALVRSGFNRRTNVYDPDESLLLKKPLLRVSHVGGKRLQKTDVAYSVLRQWIYEGAKPDAAGAPECVGISVYPGPERVLVAPYVSQQLSVVARFSDGTERDVTRLATYSTSHRDVARADANGLVIGRNRGLAAITIRYLDRLESVYFTVIKPTTGFVWQEAPPSNLVDRLVNPRLRLLEFPPSPVCDDSTFLRRVSLDLTGLLPSPEQTRRFLADRSPKKRAALVDALLQSRQFARFQGMRLADLLRVNEKTLTDGRAALFANWINESLAANEPYDEFARRLLTSRGDTRFVAPANYYAAVESTEELTEATAQIFMGSRIQCAKCHNHPFENWTQSDYYRIGAVFHRVARDESVIAVLESGEMRHPKSGSVMRPWNGRLNDAANDTQSASDRRQGFARWLTQRGNPYFARVEVNRIWAHLIGRGIVEPIDDFRASNPPSNVQLLDGLAEEFEKSGFDRRHIYRLICNSMAYQRSSATTAENEDDERLASHATLRLLRAEQLLDAIGNVTGTLPFAAQLPAHTAAIRKEIEAVARELQTNRADWEQKHRDGMRAATCWHGEWWAAGPFPAGDVKTAHDRRFEPEQTPLVDLSARFQDGRLGWRRRLEWHSGQRVEFKKKPAVTYIYHVVNAKRDVGVKLVISADDSMKVWRNGEVVYDKAENAADVRVPTMLQEGENRFLIKVVNRGGAYHWSFGIETEGDETVFGGLPGSYATILAQAPDQRSADDSRLLNTFYESRNGRLTELQRQYDELTRQRFATQRAIPAQTNFLKAFGQPERSTPCACERRTDPTLEQVLQLLNGETVHGYVERGAATYGQLSNDEAVEQLYLAAYSRAPNADEAKRVVAYLASSKDRDAAIRDVIWAVINTQEFLFQH